MLTALKLPYRVIHAAYHAAIPYDRRLIFWSWRRRQLFGFRQYLRGWNLPQVNADRAELKTILAQYPNAKGVVVFPPCVPWYTELFQRPHQMALAFASLGYVVLYWVEDIDKQDVTVHFRKVAEGVHLCKVPPAAFSVCGHPIVISYTYNYIWARLLHSPVLVYELIDHLDIFSNFSRRMLKASHRALLRNAHVVVGTANDLVAELKPSRSDALLCPNGVDIQHFALGEDDSNTVVPDDMQALVAEGKPIIGYYGALAEWFDFDLLKHAAQRLPEFNFVLIGPDYDGLTIARSGIDRFPNIHWLGPKPYKDLPQYLHAFDVATIPFAVTEALQAVSPIKLFEYMAGERPIVTTDLVECRKYPVVRIARNPEEWVERLREGVQLRGTPGHIAELRRTAWENTWTTRAEQILAALDVRRNGGTVPSSSAPLSRLRIGVSRHGRHSGTAVNTDSNA